MLQSVSTLWNYLVLRAVSIAEVSALSCAPPEQWAVCSEQGQRVTVTALCLKAEHSSSQAEAADLWMESVWMWDAAGSQLWPGAERGCPLPCGLMPKCSSAAQAFSSQGFSEASQVSCAVYQKFSLLTATTCENRRKSLPPNRFCCGCFWYSWCCKIVGWQKCSVCVLCIAIVVYQNCVLSRSRFLSAGAKRRQLLFQTTGKFCNLFPQLLKRAQNSGADSRRLGCSVALYFGFLTVSLTQCCSGLAFFATPEDNKEAAKLKAWRQYLHKFPPLSAGRKRQIFLFYMVMKQDVRGTDVLPAHASLLQQGKNQTWKNSSEEREERKDAVWAPPAHSPHRCNDEENVWAVTWLAHMPLGYGEGALLCGSCF